MVVVRPCSSVVVIEPKVVSMYVLGGALRAVEETRPGTEAVDDGDEVWIGAEVVADCDGEMTLSEDEGPALLCPVLLLLCGGVEL